MEEIDLKEIFSYFWSKKIYVFLITVIVVSLGIIYTFCIQKPVFKSDTTILLTKESATTGITSDDILLNQKLVDTYREIVKSKSVLGRVINNLNLNYTTSELQRKVSVESINDTEILRISVTDKSNILAKEIANEIAVVFESEIIKLYDIQNIGIIDKAEVEDSPYNVNIIKQMVISLFLGIIVGLGAVFIMFYFDNTLKSAAMIETKLGLSVIGTIPESGDKKNE